MEKLKMNLQYFADGADDSTPDQTGNSEEETKLEEKETPPTLEEKEQEEKTFKQDEVNNIATKEAKKAQEKLLKQLGIDDFQNAKEGMQKFKEWQESQKTEQEKQTERLTGLETTNTTLTEENSGLKAQISAMKAGVNTDSVEDVVTLAQRLLDDDTDMDAAVAKVVERYPHFAGQKKEQEEKPSFSNGQHQKKTETQADQWAAAFKN
ncbi:phage protein [Bacillus sp. JCM 19046]|nr:phage protein [Bacillus sp. JCM 19045]GAF18907.1 phage protein [Bacillus sp. JCM 19046]